MLTAEHKEKRKGLITSSIAAAALGLNSYMTPLQAALACRGELPDVDTKATDRGNRLEDLILDYPADVYGWRREPAPFVAHVNGWAGDSADALYYDGDKIVCVGEGKSAGLGVAVHYGEEGTDEIPDSTLIQAHWHLAHWPVSFCVVPVLVGGFTFEFREYRVDRDDDLIAQLFADLGEWHARYVLGGELPAPGAGDSEIVKNRWPANNGNMAPSTPEIEQLARDKAHAAAMLKIAKADDERAANLLRAAIGESDGVSAEWGKATWKRNRPSVKTDWQAIATEAGASAELIAKHTVEKPGARVLRVNVKG